MAPNQRHQRPHGTKGRNLEFRNANIEEYNSPLSRARHEHKCITI